MLMNFYIAVCIVSANLADMLHEARMMLLSKERCEALESVIDNGEPYKFEEITMCAGFLDGHSSACDVCSRS